MLPSQGYIVSLKYSPVFANLCMAIGEPLRQKGINIRYLWASGYKWMKHGICIEEYVDYVDTDSSILGTIKDFVRYSPLVSIFNKLLNKHSVDFVILVNSTPLNYWFSSLAKKRNNSLIVKWLHEPYEPNKRLLGRRRSLLLSVLEAVQSLEIYSSDVIVLFSQEAQRRYESKYGALRKQLYVHPLLFRDYACRLPLERKFLTFVGHVVPEKCLDRFVDLVNFTVDTQNDLEYQIISSSDLTKYLERVDPKAKTRLKVINRPKIDDHEIGYALRESYMVFALRRRVAQSGIIPVAFMNGTPVLVNRLPGATEFIEDRVNGYIVSEFPSNEELLVKLLDAKRAVSTTSEKCRLYYDNNFDSRNAGRYYSWLDSFLTGRHSTAAQ